MDIAQKTLQLKQDFDDVYEAGKKAERDGFWDTFQDNGNRSNYNNAFARGGFTADNFYPKYDLVLQGDNSYMFFTFTEGKLFSLKKRIEDCGIKFDTSQSTSLLHCFGYSDVITEIPTIDVSNGNPNAVHYIFCDCTNLTTVEKLIVKESLVFNLSFRSCKALVNITIEGTIGQNGFDIHWSTKLSADSLKSIITALSTSTTGLTITLPTTAQANYEAVYGTGSWATLTATKSNWTIAYA